MYHFHTFPSSHKLLFNLWLSKTVRISIRTESKNQLMQSCPVPNNIFKLKASVSSGSTLIADIWLGRGVMDMFHIIFHYLRASPSLSHNISFRGTPASWVWVWMNPHECETQWGIPLHGRHCGNPDLLEPRSGMEADHHQDQFTVAHLAPGGPGRLVGDLPEVISWQRHGALSQYWEFKIRSIFPTCSLLSLASFTSLMKRRWDF